MLTLATTQGVRLCDGLSRRDFLRAGSLAAGAAHLSLADLTAGPTQGRAGARDINCILLFLVGGPSQLETWDLKPNAPDHIRGPFRPIQTNVPGMRICEHFPRMAQISRHYAIVRSVHHQAAPIHETGHQLMQTGRLFREGQEHPHYGAVVSHLRGQRPGGLPPFVVMPSPINHTGVGISHGQGAGFLGPGHEPYIFQANPASPHFRLPEFRIASGDPARLPDRYALLDAVDEAQRAMEHGATQSSSATYQGFQPLFSPVARRAFDIAAENDRNRARYGHNTFGQSCLLARRLIEHGVRLVTVNMFDTVFNKTTWDAHADGGSLGVTLNDYRDTLCPMFDQAYTGLLEDLHERGQLDTTLVVAMGEFGRTPHLNARGGRDHHPGVWSILFAGGGVRGGQVIGASDRWGAEPSERPVTPGEIAATIYRGLGIGLDRPLLGPGNRPFILTDAAPIAGIFG